MSVIRTAHNLFSFFILSTQAISQWGKKWEQTFFCPFSNATNAVNTRDDRSGYDRLACSLHKPRNDGKAPRAAFFD